MSPPAIPIALCADDFGLAPGVSQAIADLAVAGRLTSISCMTGTTHWRAESGRLRDLPDGIEIGLHVTLASHDRSLAVLAAEAFSGRLNSRAIASEIETQLDRFEAAAGRQPDFLDGHLHVHQLPSIRDVVAEIWRTRLAGRPWIRNTATSAERIARRPVARLRAGALSCLGAGARRRWSSSGAATNADFAGVRDFNESAGYRTLMRHYLRNPRAGLLVMCHPGLPDSSLAAVDPVVEPRRGEFDYLASGEFVDDLRAAGAYLQPISRTCARVGS